MKICFKLRKATTEIHKLLENVYGNKALSCTMSPNGLKDSRNGHADLTDDPRNGQLSNN
jgi:hypothetical protein